MQALAAAAAVATPGEDQPTSSTAAAQKTQAADAGEEGEYLLDSFFTMIIVLFYSLDSMTKS